LAADIFARVLSQCRNKSAEILNAAHIAADQLAAKTRNKKGANVSIKKVPMSPLKT
jgi:hypothetical protein